MKKRRRSTKVGTHLRSAPMSRYLRISATSGNSVDPLEALASIALGSNVVERNHVQFSEGLNGDMRALGYDFHNVLRRLTTDGNDQRNVAAE